MPQFVIRIAFTSLCVGVAAFLAACGGGSEGSDADVAADAAPAQPATVGAGGGTVSAFDGAVTLDVPSGALAEEIEIRLVEGDPATLPAEITDLVEVTQLIQLEPSGVQFAEPVRLTLHFPIGTPAEDGSESALPILAMRSGETYELLDNQSAALDMDTGMLTLSADLHHFSEVWDNLPRDGGIRVRYSGVPGEWRVGEDNKFTVTSTISQEASSSLHFIDVRWESWNNSPIRPWIICEDGCDMGILDTNRAQTLTRTDEYWCSEAGQGRWTAKVEFGDDLAQALYSAFAGARTSLSLWDQGGTPTYTSEAFRSIRCTGGDGVGEGSGSGVAVTPVRLSSLRSELRAPVTTYAIAVIGGGNLTFEWKMEGEQCGTPRVPWTQTGPIVQWSHSDEEPDNCTHVTPNHTVTTTVTVSQDGVPQFTCTVIGSGDGFPDWNRSCNPPQGRR